MMTLQPLTHPLLEQVTVLSCVLSVMMTKTRKEMHVCFPAVVLRFHRSLWVIKIIYNFYECFRFESLSSVCLTLAELQRI